MMHTHGSKFSWRNTTTDLGIHTIETVYRLMTGKIKNLTGYFEGKRTLVSSQALIDPITTMRSEITTMIAIGPIRNKLTPRRLTTIGVVSRGKLKR